jgi:hypothetical protein
MSEAIPADFLQVFWGPLSFVVALLITAQHPLRHPLQALVALGQIYGDILYYATSMFDHYHKGLTYCRPEAYYFWFYYFFLNFIWIVIPGGKLIFLIPIRFITRSFVLVEHRLTQRGSLVVQQYQSNRASL